MTSSSPRLPDALDPAPEQRCQIDQYFEQTRFGWSLVTFRSLCNAFKSSALDEALQVWKRSNAARPVVLDLGVGKGGDLMKVSALRPKHYYGVDINKSSVAECVERYQELMTKGRVNFAGDFKVLDFTADVLPYPAQRFDVIISNFAVHFSCATLEDAKHAFGEMHRVAKKGAVVMLTYPDARRVASALRSSGRFGHFSFDIDSVNASRLDASSPFGVWYRFKLLDEWCPECMVDQSVLESLLETHGFSVVSNENSHAFVKRRGSESLRKLLMNATVTGADWTSLGLFRVTIATKASSDVEL